MAPPRAAERGGGWRERLVGWDEGAWVRLLAILGILLVVILNYSTLGVEGAPWVWVWVWGLGVVCVCVRCLPVFLPPHPAGRPAGHEAGKGEIIECRQRRPAVMHAVACCGML